MGPGASASDGGPQRPIYHHCYYYYDYGYEYYCDHHYNIYIYIYIYIYIHIIIESLRNSFDLIRSHLKTFVVEHVLFAPEEGDAQGTYHYWVQLGMQSDVAETLPDLSLHWANGHLQVNDKHKSSGGLHLDAGHFQMDQIH